MSRSAETRPDTDDYRALFLGDLPLIDTRAPVEFSHGAFPAAVNLPLMTDEERAQVGTCYKEHGQQAAIAMGHQLVNGAVRRERVEQWLSFARQQPNGYLYCFRGGLRSQICQQWITEAGLHYPRVIGGYKAMRRFLLAQLERYCMPGALIVLAGHTGAAKTELLKQIPMAVDLEHHANHRGSAFGKRPDGQPSQIDFENAVIIDMLKKRDPAPNARLVLEDESRLIGRCSLPPILRDAMAKAPLVLLEADLEARTEHSWENYILRKSTEWTEEVGAERGFDCFVDDLRESLSRIRKRLGADRYAEIGRTLENAITAHRQGDASQHKLWIRKLLEDYYDPMYQWQWQRHESRVLFRGHYHDVLNFLLKHADH